jgi:hypothetical protein
MADYLEGHLPLARRALFDAHLDDCAECAREISAMQETIGVLRSLPEPEVPPHLADNALRRIRNGEANPPWYDHVRHAVTTLLSPRVLAPVSAGMLVMGVITWVGESQLPGQGPGVAPSPVLVQADPPAAGGGSGTTVAANRAAQRIAASPRGGGVPSAQDPLGPSHQWASQLDTLVGRMRRNQRFEPPLAEPTQTVQVAGRPDQGYPTGNRYGTAGGQSRVPQQHPSAPGDQPLPSADAWLLHAQRSPAAFAAELYQLTLAEQELWVGSLSRHAAQEGSLDTVISALQSSQSEQARLLAQDFRAAGERMTTAAVDAGN